MQNNSRNRRKSIEDCRPKISMRSGSDGVCTHSLLATARYTDYFPCIADLSARFGIKRRFVQNNQTFFALREFFHTLIILHQSQNLRAFDFRFIVTVKIRFHAKILQIRVNRINLFGLFRFTNIILFLKFCQCFTKFLAKNFFWNFNIKIFKTNTN